MCLLERRVGVNQHRLTFMAVLVLCRELNVLVVVCHHDVILLSSVWSSAHVLAQCYPAHRESHVRDEYGECWFHFWFPFASARQVPLYFLECAASAGAASALALRDADHQGLALFGWLSEPVGVAGAF